MILWSRIVAGVVLVLALALSASAQDEPEQPTEEESDTPVEVVGSPTQVIELPTQITPTSAPTGTAFPTATRAPNVTPSPTPMPGTVLLQDNFDDPRAGWFPQSSPDPERYQVGYVDGQYVISKGDPTLGVRVLTPPGTYSDASLAVDVQLQNSEARPAESQLISLICRVGAGTSYGFTVEPPLRMFRLSRGGPDAVVLSDWQTAPSLLRGDATNRLEITCSGTTISASVNGVQVASVQDATFRSGTMVIGVGNSRGASTHVWTTSLSRSGESGASSTHGGLR